MRKSGFIFILCFTAIITFAQNANRKFIDYQIIDNKLKIRVNDGQYIIQPYSEKIIETTFIPSGQTYDTVSYAVVLDPHGVATELMDNDQSLIFTTPGMTIEIQKTPFKINYFYKNNYLISEKEGYVKTDTTEEIEFNLDESEILYGGGTRVLGMNRRGYRLKLYNRAHYGYTTHSELMNYCLPMMLSSKIYAVHFDNAAIGFMDFDSKGDNTLVYETISGRKTYQVITGDNWPDLLDQYTDLTGKQPLPPRWAFGNFASRFGYHSQKEVEKTVNLFWQDSIPLDAVVIDIYWFGADIQGHMGNLEFLADSFPTPWKMMADFKKKGVKTILVTEPFILTTSNKWDEAVKKKILATDSEGNPYTYDFYFGNTGLIDIFNPEAESWFWDFYKEFTQKGVGGWWGDLGEPEVHPSGLQHVVGSADEVHNVYGHYWAKLIYEGYQRDFPDQRPFILMRSGYSGSQRYGLIPWTGDVDRSWGGLKPQPELSLQMGLQGIAYMHSDLGGFAGGEIFDPELYVRWLQYGVFQPIFRPHAQEHIPAEPVFHDVKTLALAKNAIELRYSLLPYNYTLAFENHQSGIPLMRPLFFEEPQNRKLLEISDTYLWGKNFLVCPVLFKDSSSKVVYFPKNNNWFDFYTGVIYRGGTTQIIQFVEDHIPVFVRGGAFIPMVQPVQSTKYYTTSDLILHYYFDPEVSESSDQLFDDDGITPKTFEKGQYELLTFTGITELKQIKINLDSKTGDHHKAINRKVELIIHNIATEPQKIKVNKTEVPFEWDEGSGRLVIRMDWLAGKNVNIELFF
ncbi:MAG: DUF4968 domain-containing protein [Bacteroidales bacterium]|nr:DUF4968 domain-containing protein [Bacteroidales bacterium]